MRQALALGKEALDNGNPPVGAVLVYDDKIIGKGIESGKSTGDITNHAEILAVRDAIKKGFTLQLEDSLLYTTHEPCIMCSYVIRHHKIAGVIYGVSVDHIGGHTSEFDLLITRKVPKWDEIPEVVSGILKDQCLSLTEQFQRNIKNQ